MKTPVWLLAIFILQFQFLGAVAQHRHRTRHHKARVARKRPATSTRTRIGTASFYDGKFRGRKTSNGDIYSQRKMTGASNVLPLGALVRVTCLKNKRSVVIRINDRMHRRNRRLIDVSRMAATRLRMTAMGLVRVKVVVLSLMKQVRKRR